MDDKNIQRELWNTSSVIEKRERKERYMKNKRKL